jgi:RNA polymerase sigma-70 factor (ECF subfamily)
MWEIWRRAASYSPALGNAEAWMLMVARSRAIDLLRRDRRAAELKAELARRAREHEASPASAAPGRREGLDACDRALEDLSPEQASVIRLAYLRGLSREQIAEALEIPVGTVKTRIRTGIRTMIETLATGQAAGGEARA